MPEVFEFGVEDIQGVHVVRLHGELDVANADRLREFLIEVAGSTVEVDLTDLRFMDASGIGALLGARQVITDGGNEFVVRGANGEVRRILDICGVSFLLAGAPGPSLPKPRLH